MPAYPPGTPSWVELSTSDPNAAAGFYRQTMGWDTTEPGPVEESGGYRMFQLDGKSVGGLMGHMQEGQPTAWATYISVDDADATAEKVKAAGGSVMVEPMDVMELGRMAFFADPGGAVFGVWQPKGFDGAEVVNEPGSLCWNEVMTRDPERAQSFYPAVFGWNVGRPMFEGAPDSYRVWQVDDHNVGGLMKMNDDFFPPEVPAHWSVCFAVADCDATAEAARNAGGTVAFGPMDMPIGRFAGLVDPQGAPFAVMQMPAG